MGSFWFSMEFLTCPFLCLKRNQNTYQKKKKNQNNSKQKKSLKKKINRPNSLPCKRNHLDRWLDPFVIVSTTNILM